MSLLRAYQLSKCSSIFYPSVFNTLKASRKCYTTETTSSTPATNNNEHMTWDQYFQHKKTRRIRDQILSVPAGIIGGSTTFSYLMTTVVLDPSTNGMIFGFDPFLVFILSSALSGTLCFLGTPLLGSLIYRVIKPKTYQQITEKDADFYKRVAKYRVNMSLQPRSVAAPPDYYGEKVLSKKDYRHWLRRQFDYKRQISI